MNIHTKGPWAILPRNRNLANGRGPGYDVQKDDPDGLGEIICDKATLANAHLIAAAPEMLEALRGLVAEIQNGGYVPRLEDSAKSYQTGRAFGLAKVVIAKAERGTV